MAEKKQTLGQNFGEAEASEVVAEPVPAAAPAQAASPVHFRDAEGALFELVREAGADGILREFTRPVPEQA